MFITSSPYHSLCLLRPSPGANWVMTKAYAVMPYLWSSSWSPIFKQKIICFLLSSNFLFKFLRLYKTLSYLRIESKTSTIPFLSTHPVFLIPISSAVSVPTIIFYYYSTFHIILCQYRCPISMHLCLLILLPRMHIFVCPYSSLKYNSRS